jgi:hypothetical protein
MISGTSESACVIQDILKGGKDVMLSVKSYTFDDDNKISVIMMAINEYECLMFDILKNPRLMDEGRFLNINKQTTARSNITI